MKRLIYTVFVALFILSNVHAEDKSGSSRNRQIAKTAVSWSKKARQSAGDFKVWFSNQMTMGQQAWDGNVPVDPLNPCGNQGIGAAYPASQCIEHLYGAGPWIGGRVNGVVRVTEGYNGNDGNSYFLPEQKDTARDKIWAASKSDTSEDLNRIGYYKRGMGKREFDDDGDGKIDEDELDGFDNDKDWVKLTDDVGADGLPDNLEVGCRGAYDPASNADPSFDNYDPTNTKRDTCHPNALGIFPSMRNKDLYTQGNSIPDHGEPHVDEDYFAYSDNDLYMTATDTFKNPTYPNHTAMGIKIWQRSYAWNIKELYSILPMEYLFINVGKNVIKNVYVGFFADMDVSRVGEGQYVNNYAGYLDTVRTAYIHNPINAETTPLGLTVLETPRSLDSLTYTFQWHDFDPPCGGTADSALYSCMSCEAFGGVDCIKPDQDQTSLHDTRFIFSFGEFDEIKPGDTLKIAVALITGNGIRNGENNLYDNAEKAFMVWNRKYRTSKVPPSPCLDTTVGFKKIQLRWGGGGMRSIGEGNFACTPMLQPSLIWDDSSKIAESFPPDHWRRINPPEGHTRGGRTFEGYRLYRSESEVFDPSSFTLLRQYDIPDDIWGYNVGVDTSFVDTNLFRGKTYWYSVTSFSIPDLTIIERKNPSGTGVLLDSIYNPSPESDISENAMRITLPFSVSEKLGEVLAVPNPYRVDQNYTTENGGWEGRASDWDENQRMLKFIHLPRRATIRVFTLTGDLVTTLEHEAGVEDRGELDWDILSESHRALASGIYVFTVESEYGRQVGKFVLIR